MDIKPIWFKYATFGEDGFVNGIRDDAPDDIKRAYAEYKQEKQQEAESEMPIMKY